MIDSITVEGTLKAYELSDLKRAAQVVFLQSSSTKFKQGIEYVQSPLTGAQMELNIFPYFGQLHDDLVTRIKIPLASSLLGQNYMHGWTECVNDELKAASQLIRVVLEQYQFKPEEVNKFIETAKTESAELTWHVASASYRAAKNLLMRAYRQVKVLHKHNSRHDIGIESYSFIEESQRESLKVFLKNGSALKIYVKADEMRDTKRRKPRGTPMYEAHRVDKIDILKEIGTHLRVEVIPGKEHLRELGLLNPKSWNPASLEGLVDQILTLAGFTTPYAIAPLRVDVSACSQTVQKTFELYRHDPSLPLLSNATISRHRVALLPFGVDIGISPADHRMLSSSIGRQLHYANRWKVPDHLRHFIASEKTLPVLSETLTAMLEKIRGEYTPERLAELEHARFKEVVPNRRA